MNQDHEHQLIKFVHMQCCDHGDLIHYKQGTTKKALPSPIKLDIRCKKNPFYRLIVSLNSINLQIKW